MNEQAEVLRKLYRRRFDVTAEYRHRVWEVLSSSLFQQWVPRDGVILDLGCGYGEFINTIQAGKKLAMDMNPDASERLDKDVACLLQDCSLRWAVGDAALDVIFTSNFFEHLPDKLHLRQTIQQAYRCLKPGGRLIAVGPNIKHLPGEYWDFFDHHTMLTEMSLGEVLVMEGFTLEKAVSRFLPYTLVNAPEYPLWCLRLYLKLPLLWRIVGRQFLVMARKPEGSKP
jgi:SAM-dependent methyltransferase